MKTRLVLLGALAWAPVLFAQQITAPPPPARGPAAPAAAPKTADAPKPPADAPKNNGGAQPIKVTSDGGAEMVPEKNLIIWIDNVHFEHPDQKIKIDCDRLEVIQDTPPPAPPKPPLEAEAGKNGGATPAPAPAQDDLQIKSATAIGNVKLEKIGANGDLLKGTGTRAYFDAKTHDMQLSGRPSLDTPQAKFRAMDDKGVIIIKENGQHKLEKGPFETQLKQAKGNPATPGAPKPPASPTSNQP